MTMVATNPSGKRSDGTHWQSDKQVCIRGHDLREALDDGTSNPNVRRHSVTGTRQCVACARTRARLSVRLSTAMKWWTEHCARCRRCPGGRYCEDGRAIRRTITQRMRDLADEGFVAGAMLPF